MWRSTMAVCSSTCCCACGPAPPAPQSLGRRWCAGTAGPSTTPISTTGRRPSWSRRASTASAWAAAASPTRARRRRSTSTGTRWALGEQITL